MPAAFDDSFDYLTLLGLNPAAVAVQDSSEVREAIKRKKKEWTAQAINPLYQQQARANLERAKQFESILGDPAALAAYLGYHAELVAARRKRYEKEVAELVILAAAGGKRVITIEQHDLLRGFCEDRGIPPDLLPDVLAWLKFKVGDAAPAGAGTKPPYKEPALDRTLLAQINNHLRVLEKKSFYDLLDLPSNATAGRVLATAQILYDRWSKALPKTSECVAWEKSLQACLTYLKDDGGKRRYDHALFNQRLDEFLSRIDLVLASGKLSKEGHASLAQIGVKELGLSNALVNQCILQRAAGKGLSLTKPVNVTVQTDGQVQCRRCFRWNSTDAKHCGACGNSLIAVCRNPACKKPLPASSKTCDHCGLTLSRGGQYAELLKLIDALLNTGGYRAALDACKLANQILPSPEVEQLTQRAGRMRVLASSLRRAASDKQWSQVERELTQLLQLAPQFLQPGIPPIEEVTQYVSQMQRRVEQIPADFTPEAVAKTCLEILTQWTDCESARQKLFQAADALEASGRHDLALEAINRLATLEPLNDELQSRSVRLGHKTADIKDQQARLTTALQTYRRALEENRLYAAERALQELEDCGWPGLNQPEAPARREGEAPAEPQGTLDSPPLVAGLSNEPPAPTNDQLSTAADSPLDSPALLVGVQPATPRTPATQKVSPQQPVSLGGAGQGGGETHRTTLLPSAAADSPTRADSDRLKTLLAEIRADVQATRDFTQSATCQNEVIDRWLAILGRCRDCREALAALQAITPDPPLPPTDFRIVLQGHRRVLTWSPVATGELPQEYVVQRSVQRAGARSIEPTWTTLAASAISVPHFVDDDVVHTGSVIRYAVQSRLRGVLSVASHVLKEYDVTSVPAFAEPLLLWQEPVALKVRAIRTSRSPETTGRSPTEPDDSTENLPDTLDLTWHQPAGARQTLIHRWIGTRDDRPAEPELLSTAETGRYRDERVESDLTYTYLLSCLFDSPSGDFLTPGVMITATLSEAQLVPASGGRESPGDVAIAQAAELKSPPISESSTNTAAAPAAAHPETDFTDILDQATVAGLPTEPSAADRKDQPNPLKRHGLWPPAPKP